MKILVVADEESRSLYEYYSKEKLADIDLILSCGDLSRDYLEFLVTMGHAPLLYVAGNHDDSFAQKPPTGCIPIDEKIYNFHGLRVGGLSGSVRYKESGAYQYTEEQQRRRVQRLRRSIERYHGIDIFLTHAPARGLGDGSDFPHRGFSCFYEILDRWQPLYFVHGHQHLNYGEGKRMQRYQGTKIINGYVSYILELDESDYPSERENTGSLIYDLYNHLRYGKAESPYRNNEPPKANLPSKTNLSPKPSQPGHIQRSGGT